MNLCHVRYQLCQNASEWRIPTMSTYSSGLWVEDVRIKTTLSGSRTHAACLEGKHDTVSPSVYIVAVPSDIHGRWTLRAHLEPHVVHGGI